MKYLRHLFDAVIIAAILAAITAILAIVAVTAWRGSEAIARDGIQHQPATYPTLERP